jgi:hypothetical protein
VILLTELRFWTLDRLAIRRCLLGTLGFPLDGILNVWCGLELDWEWEKDGGGFDSRSIFVFYCEEKVWRGANAPLPNANVAVVAEHGSDDSSNFPTTNNITTTDERNQRPHCALSLRNTHNLHIYYSSHVVGRIQEKCQPRDDAGDDEDRPCREDK